MSVSSLSNTFYLAFMSQNWNEETIEGLYIYLTIYSKLCRTQTVSIICDIYGNHSKSHIGSYEIIDFKDFKAL